VAKVDRAVNLLSASKRAQESETGMIRMGVTLYRHYLILPRLQLLAGRQKSRETLRVPTRFERSREPRHFMQRRVCMCRAVRNWNPDIIKEPNTHGPSSIPEVQGCEPVPSLS
jgi:hypothetical protein